MANEIVWYHSEEAGAPTLNNAAGSVLNVLDACLINGFNSKSVTSIVVASNVATATISAHGYETGKIVEFAGATPSGLNGRKKITVTGSNTVTFTTTGISDQTATGTITAKRPGLGWTKAHSGTNKAIYARTDVTATTMMLRIDDTGTGVASTNYARALMVESASDVDTYDNPAPTEVSSAGGYIIKGDNNSTAKPWVVVGDSKTVYFLFDQDNWSFASYGGLVPYVFGDIKSYKAGDAYNCILGVRHATTSGNPFSFSYPLGSTPSDPGLALARRANAIGGYVKFYPVAGVSGMIGAVGPAYPSYVDNGLVAQREVFVTEANAAFGSPIRGVFRGFVAPLANVGRTLHKVVLSDVVGLNRELLVVCALQQSQQGSVMFDITGPWE